MGIYDRPYYSEEVPNGLAPSWNQRSAISNIIIANGVVFLLSALLSPRGSSWMIEYLALTGDNLREPWNWWRLLTYGFAHDPNGIGHIFWNMLGLWMLGRAVEDLYGRTEFLKIYLLSVLFCGSVWMLRHGLMGIPSSVVGASGAVCCIEMLFVLNFPKVILMIWGVVPVPAWVMGIFLVLGNIYVEPSHGGSEGPSIAYDVHLAGIAFAAAYYWMGWNFRGISEPMELFRKQWKRWTGPRLRVHKPALTSVRDDEEMDRLLQKIHDDGPDSLTASEKKFMEKYSRRVRARRQQP